MSIVTRKGDGGKTSLYGGRIVSKDHARIQACGNLDELCSFLGIAKSLIKQKKTQRIIKTIQRDLFILGAELACDLRSIRKLRQRIKKQHVLDIEGLIENLENRRKIKINAFCLPGENPISAVLDVARAITRRIERDVVGLKRRKQLRDNCIVIYLNRLSDFLYLLARSLENKPFDSSPA
jgi:ATP:cob(I)alamin adenosyltransferase